MTTAFRRVHGGELRRSRLCVGTLLAFVAALLLAPAGASAIGISKLAVGPIAADRHCNPNITPEQMKTDAAMRSDFCVAFYTTGGDPATGDDMREVQTRLPQGFLATADTTPHCTRAQFDVDRGEAARCPANSQIGSGEAVVRISLNGLIIPRTIKANVWNLEHTPNEVAVIGIELAAELGGIPLPHSKLLGRTTLRPAPDVGLITTISNQPRTADLGSLLGKHPIVIDGFFLRFWGSKNDHPSLEESFAMLGSDCENEQIARMAGKTYNGGTTQAEDRYRLTNCESVPLNVSTEFSMDERRPDVPSGAEIVVNVEQERDPRFQGNQRKQVVTLPAGVTLGPQVATGAAGLPLCSPEQFGWERSKASECPAGSKVADVAIISPLQKNTFAGAAYLGQQPAKGELPQLFIEGGFGELDDAPRVKLRGVMKIDEQGRVQTTIDNLPQVAFQQFRLKFRGGPHAPLITPRQCGTTSGQVVATPSSGKADIVQPISLTIDEDCIDPARFEPSMEYRSSSTQAGARSPLTVVTSRPDRTDRLAKIVHDLPAGIVSDLKLATECPVALAAQQACPESSRVGSVSATAGVGPAPSTVTGSVYLGERQEGDVAGIIISTAVKFGEVDLGYLNLPARVQLRPDDQGLKLTSDLPQTFKGVPLNLRSVSVTLDREGFSINPTSCAPLSAVGTMTAESGETAVLTQPFQMTGCENLGFDPSLSFAIDGPTKTGSKPSVKINIGLPSNGSNMKSTVVAQPVGIAADIKQMPRACDESTWNAGTCGPDAVIGSVAAKLAITDEDIAGTVSLVRSPQYTLPAIGIQLQGRFATRLLGKTTLDLKTGQTQTSFETLPDVPLSSLQMTLEGGPRGALVTTKSLCANGTATMNGTFVGHAGASAKRDPKVECDPAVAGAQASGGSVRVSGTLRKGLTLRVTPPPSGKVTGFRFALPSGVSVKSAKITKKKRLRGASTVSISGKRTVSSVLPKAGKTSLTIKVPKGSVQLSRKANRRTKWTVSFRVKYAGGKTQTVKASIKR